MISHDDHFSAQGGRGDGPPDGPPVLDEHKKVIVDLNEETQDEGTGARFSPIAFRYRVLIEVKKGPTDCPQGGSAQPGRDRPPTPAPLPLGCGNVHQVEPNCS